VLGDVQRAPSSGLSQLVCHSHIDAHGTKHVLSDRVRELDDDIACAPNLQRDRDSSRG
jgi:hypothetical protein